MPDGLRFNNTREKDALGATKFIKACRHDIHSKRNVVSFVSCLVCLFDLIFTSHQQSFNYIRTGIPGFNQY